MTATAPWPFLPRAESVRNAYSAAPLQPSAPSADRRESLRGLPAGPGLSAVEMAAACMCLADAVWHTPPEQPVPMNRDSRLRAPGVAWNE